MDNQILIGDFVKLTRSALKTVIYYHKIGLLKEPKRSSSGYGFKENSYASTVIQVENEQLVISSEPYSIVRHPMYLGMITMSIFIPLALGSYFSVIPMLLIIPITILRIKKEEEVLIRELNGYKDYCLKTHYRLIAFVR